MKRDPGTTSAAPETGSRTGGRPGARYELVQAPRRERRRPGDASRPAGPPVGRRTANVVLIADDTYDTRELYGMYFANQGFRVLTACDGEAAVHVALGERPDVIVMDLSMPELDGIAAIRRLKEDPRTRRTRVILLTGYPYTAIQRGGLGGGADVFLTKPCLPQDLERHVRHLLDIGPGVW